MMQDNPDDDLIEVDEDGWQVLSGEPMMNCRSTTVPVPTASKKQKTVASSNAALSNDREGIIELDEEGWQVFPTSGAVGPTSSKKPKRSNDLIKSSNGTVGRSVNVVRREFWNTPAPSASSMSTSIASVPPWVTPHPAPPRPLAALPPSKQMKPTSVIDSAWELIDPNPDVHALFMLFNATYFWDKLGAVTVEWSPRMTTCAGLCYFKRVNRLSECSIKLSLPLLKLRPRKDLVETLLHEMIHAYLFMEPVRGASHDRDGHGPNFQEHMHRINSASGSHITIYHSFHDEVGHYKQHWWQCNGPCRHRHPFYGLVKRAMNRPPGPNDRWWSEHGSNCDGTFIKVKEPPKVDKENKKRTATATATSTSWSGS